MKKAIAFLTFSLVISLTVQAQKKEEIKILDNSPKTLVSIKNNNTDTVTIEEACKVIKIGNQVIDVAVLKEAVLILNTKQINGFYQGIQEYPARFANPFSEYFIKYFGLKQEAPPKQK